MTTDILDKFTSHLKNIFAKSYSLASELSSETIEPEHLLLALILEQGSVGGEILRKFGMSAEELRQALRFNSKPNQFEKIIPRLGDETKRAIEKTALIANLNHNNYIGTEHLLMALADLENPGLIMLISAQNIIIEDLKLETNAILKNTSKLNEITQAFDGATDENYLNLQPKNSAVTKAEKPKSVNKAKAKTPGLDLFTVDLTALARDGKIDPVIGREKEVERMTQILCRRTKNNPALLGDPGVGKTAIVEGLASKIIEGNVPEPLLGKRLLSLDLGMMLAGTIYRGEFEGRVKQIIDEVKNNTDVILFIDELHTIMGAGATNGSIDAANILKPALARGELRTIGATTLNEYKKHIENDSALERRFQVVMVDPPSVEAAIDILKGLRPKYEAFHGITITDEAIESAVVMSDRFIADRFLPDKAIDLIDEASAMTRIAHCNANKKVTNPNIELELENIRAEKQTAVNNEQFVKALELKSKEEELLSQLSGDKSPSHSAEASRDRLAKPSIGKREIAIIIGKATGIPVSDLVMEERERLLKLEEVLSEHIVGQKEAVASVAEFVRRAKVGIANPGRPLASFLFLGPSGVGKTELAKTLAQTIFQDKDAMVRLDMSEFSEPFSVSKLVGSPAGYVGYKDSTKLTDTIKRKPYSLVLFDEIEKAHGDLHNLLLQILDDGRITDAAGRTVNFKNTIIIMTSNVGAGLLQEKTMGFGEHVDNELKGEVKSALKTDIMAELERAFRPEFINRIDKVLMFDPLTMQDLEGITKLQLDDLSARVKKEHGVAISFKPMVYEFIAQQSFNPLYGARPVRRSIQELIENPLAKEILSFDATRDHAADNKGQSHKNFSIDVKDDAINISLKRAKVRLAA